MVSGFDMENTMQDEYLIQSPRIVGNTVVWWAPNSEGYTTDPYLAGVYTLEEAKKVTKWTSARIWKKTNVLPWASYHVDINKLYGVPYINPETSV